MHIQFPLHLQNIFSELSVETSCSIAGKTVAGKSW